MHQYLFQILLPLFDNDGREIDRKEYRRVTNELVDKFGGVTAFTRTPAEGRWRKSGKIKRDEVVILEVVTASRSITWWRNYRSALERRFRQEAIVIRMHEIEQI